MKADMKTTVEKVSSLQRKLNIEVPATVVANAFNSVFKSIQKNANIKGFRPGKAPMATIKTMYKDRVQQDVVQDLIQKHYYEAIREHQLEPISYPEFEFDVPKEDTQFAFTASIEVKPEVALKKYEGLEIEKEKLEVDDKKINDVLENIRSSRAETVPVLEDRTAMKGDIAIIDFEGFVDGKPLENGAGKDHNLELGASQFIEGFEDGVLGMTPGQSKTLSLKFPDPYHAADIAGKPVDFKVTLKSLKKKQLPELNDEFVAKMMGGNMSGAGSEEKHTLASLKKNISDDITQSESKRIEQDLKNRLLKKLVSLNPVDVPPSMLKEQKKALVEDMKKRMSEQGMNDKDFDQYSEKWEKDFESTAAEMIQSGFIVDAIAKKHELSWNEQDLEAKFAEYAKQTGIDIERIREFYSRPEQNNRVTYMITEEKVISFLLGKSKISEVPKAKLPS
jgi:trigger factor